MPEYVFSPSFPCGPQWSKLADAIAEMLPLSQITRAVHSTSSGPFGTRLDIRSRRTEGEVEHHQGGPPWVTWGPWDIWSYHYLVSRTSDQRRNKKHRHCLFLQHNVVTEVSKDSDPLVAGQPTGSFSTGGGAVFETAL
jgi:hypothetical protein